MKIIDSLLSYNDAEEWARELNQFIYEYSWSFIKYLSLTENTVTNEYDDLYTIKFLSESLSDLENFDEEVLKECTKAEWIDVINSIIYKFSLYTLTDNDRICEIAVEKLQMLNMILESFKQLN